MKYRRLTKDELEHLEPNFIRFLAAQSITAEDWTTIKTANPTKAEELIKEFSDIIIEKTLHTLEYLDFREKNDYKTFHCQKDKIVLLGVMIEGDSDLNFQENIDPNEMMEKMKKSGAKLRLYSAEKPYKDGDRIRELFLMLENGCFISGDGAMYKILQELEKEE